jgi:glycosyltransferase involved in cell wall biosynthesis
MRLLFIADGRSPTAVTWMRHFVETQHEVHLLSTFACDPALDLASLNIVPVAFSGFAGGASSQSRNAGRMNFWRGARWIRLRAWIRHWLGPLTLSRAAERVDDHVQRIQPDLIHAMRIPYEGMLAAKADPKAPLVLTIWGNDFTLHAPSTPLMARATRQTLARVDGLVTDCHRDQRLAREWGFSQNRPSIVLPASGGIRKEDFHPAETNMDDWSGALSRLSGMIPADAPVVVNPRGFRSYVRNDTFFRSIPRILDAHPEAKFLCPAMAGERAADDWISRLNIEDAIFLLPHLTREEMAKVYQRAQITVSISEHDGTPNTLLEAMACGCFPVAGDLESIREWIVDNENGLLVDPGDAPALADAVSRALSDPGIRSRAAERNQVIIDERAAHPRVMAKAVDFYRSFLS